MSKAKDRAWMEQYWDTVGRARRAQRTERDRQERLEQRRAYYRKTHPDMATPRPKKEGRTAAPSLKPPKEVVQQIKEAQLRRSLRLQALTIQRWPPSAIAASRVAHTQRYSIGSSTSSAQPPS